MNETVVVRLELHDFRNFEAVEFRPSPDGLTVIQGENGAGKSSLLEAIVYCSTLQSFRGAPREAVVRQGAAEAKLRCDVLAGKRKVEIEIEVVPGRRDRAWHNGAKSSRHPWPARSPSDDVVHSGRPRARERSSRAAGVISSTTCSPSRILDSAPTDRGSTVCFGTATLFCASSAAGSIPRRRRRSTSGTTGLPRSASASPRSRAELVEALSPYAAEAFSVLAARAGELQDAATSVPGTGRSADALASSAPRRPSAGHDDSRPATRRPRDRSRRPRRPHAAFPGPPAVRRPCRCALRATAS